ncbi:tetraprenyl-beta-curcumene synthase family protein [Halalkalibacterium ligniniphilum]|uniref:tetraprenyl-beta-curcumene synthase family protein n=1 Tax=Halalkalibacterium ligniniphilum TaxID=1134413 RepID=UPI000344DF4A|nr:tetraprenyl-beta-curcumene synthase family protein [Halalkalibacterium ligniniphilum]
MKVPSHPLPLLLTIYREVVPAVHRHLDRWKEKARQIPDPELRFHALDGLTRKAFHCEGGGAFGLLGKERFDDFLSFMIAYQTMCDYLDNLCDQSESLDPNDFRALHDALLAALTPGAPLENYYRFRDEQEDGGYLHELIKTCQKTLQSFPSFEKVQHHMLQLSGYYGDLQTYKHVKKEDRVPLLEAWFEKHRQEVPPMTWYEFSACTGSTLAIYTLAIYATKPNLSEETAQLIKEGYFPWVQGAHLLLDYFIDQEEDIADDELNFLFYYESEEEMISRFQYFVKMAEETMTKLPDPKFHRMIHRGLIAIYLADEKVQGNPELKKKSKQMAKLGGIPTLFFLLNSWVFRKKKEAAL